MKNLFYKLKTITKKHKKTFIIIIIFLILIVYAFSVGATVGKKIALEGRYTPNLSLIYCVAVDKVPYENYFEVPIDNYFDLMYRMFYGENKHKEIFEKVILPKEDITYKEYYSAFKSGNNFEYFITNKGEIKKCGYWK